MSLAEVSLRHRATVFFLMAVAIIVGLVAYGELPRERYPDIQVPLVIVFVPYPGAAPAEIEKQITQPLERELTGLAGLEMLTSVSEDGQSIVTVEFAVGTDVDAALQKVRDRVDRAEVDFPTEAEESVIEEVNFADFPIVQVHLSGDVGPVVLKRIAEDFQDEIEALPGVLRANLVGGLEREVQIDVDPARLRHFGLSLDDVIDAVRDGNVAIPGGDLDLGEATYAVRVPGEVEDPRAIADFVIQAEGGRPVFVGDVATVRFGFEERASYARIDGQESVALEVQKRLGANIIAIIDEIKALAVRAESRWPAGVEATFLADQSYDIRRQIADLENSILTGLVLVVVVLMFALGLRNAIFVGVAIPFSMLLTFLALGMTGNTLNTVSLFALVLAVGMLVDNAVVVIENIYRHVQDGSDRLTAAREATREVGAAITVSTLTTLGAFAPLLFWPGIIGDFMSYLPRTVSVALLMSLLVAFTVNPVISSALMRVPRRGPAPAPVEDEAEAHDQVSEDEEAQDEPDGELLAPPPGRLERFGAAVTVGYRGLLAWALDHRLVVVGGTLALFVAVVVAFATWSRGVEFLPEVEPNQIVVDLEVSSGTRLERTDALTRTFEERLGGLTDLAFMATGVGAGSQSGGFGGGGDPNSARLSLELAKREGRSQSSFVTLAEARDLARGVPGVNVDVAPPDDGVDTGKPLQIEISGEDFSTLGAIAARVREAIDGIPGLVSLDDDFDSARPELVIDVDRVEAARLDLTTRDVARTVRTAVNGTEASSYRRGEEEIDIVVRLAETARRSIADLARLTVVTEAGDQVPLDAIARLDRQMALTSIRHKDRQRMVIVSGDVVEPRFAVPVRQEAARRLAAIPDLLPDGYRMQFGGQSEDEDEAQAFLSRAFLYAIIIVLALMVGKFDSFAIPLIIITSVLMSMIGVLIGLMLVRIPFGIIMTGVGVISLAGIVVNNAIVLLDYAEQLRARGLPRREVVMITGLRRLRPVLLTATTTILGLLPLTTGVDVDFRRLTISTGSESSQYWSSMGVAVIFGLGFATFLTLVLVPVLYDLLIELRERWGARRASGREVSSAS